MVIGILIFGKMLTKSFLNFFTLFLQFYYYCRCILSSLFDEWVDGWMDGWIGYDRGATSQVTHSFCFLLLFVFFSFLSVKAICVVVVVFSWNRTLPPPPFSSSSSSFYDIVQYEEQLTEIHTRYCVGTVSCDVVAFPQVLRGIFFSLFIFFLFGKRSWNTQVWGRLAKEIGNLYWSQSPSCFLSHRFFTVFSPMPCRAVPCVSAASAGAGAYRFHLGEANWYNRCRRARRKFSLSLLLLVLPLLPLLPLLNTDDTLRPLNA